MREVREFVEEQRAARAEAVEHGLRAPAQSGRAARGASAIHSGARRRSMSAIGVAPTGAWRARAAAVGGDRRRQPRPGRPSGEALGVEPRGLIALEPRRQDLGLPGFRRRLEAFERVEDDGQRVRPLEARLLGDMLPGEQEAQEVARRDRLDLGAQPPDRVMMDAREQPPVAPLLVVDAGEEASLEDRAVAFERGERRGDRARLEPERRGERRRRDRPQTFEPAAQDLDQRARPSTMPLRLRRRAARSPARARLGPDAPELRSAARPESIKPRCGVLSSATRLSRASASSHSLQPGAARASSSVRQPSQSSASCSSSALTGSGQASA